MKLLIKLEEFALFLFAGFLLWNTDFSWWWFPALLLVPDLSMIGYAVNSTVGAYCYNIVHHKAVAIAFYITGFYGEIAGFELVGIILFAHSSMDRIFGYGLKYADSFLNTHLSKIRHNDN